MAKEIKFPKGSQKTEFKGHSLVAFGDDPKPPQFGVGKAGAIIKMADANMEAEVIKEVICTLGMYKLKDVDAKLIVAGAKALVKDKEAA